MQKKICVYNLFGTSCPANIDDQACLLTQKLSELNYNTVLPKQSDIIYIPTQISLDKKTGTGVDVVQIQRDACAECWAKSRQKTK